MKLDVVKVRSDELIALKVLKKYFPQYQGLEILEEDKPDLKDLRNSMGVEVTRAVNEDVENIISYLNKNSKNYKKTPRPEAIERAKQEGVIYDDEGIEGFCRIFGEKEINLLHKCIKQKYDKKYQGLKIIDLYIFFRQFFMECLSDNDIQSLFQTIENCEKKCGKIFNNIIIDFYNRFLILDTTSKTCKKIKINNSCKPE